jgi:hypothetical protein
MKFPKINDTKKVNYYSKLISSAEDTPWNVPRGKNRIGGFMFTGISLSK